MDIEPASGGKQPKPFNWFDLLRSVKSPMH